MKKQPQKVIPPLGVAVFHKDGRVESVREDLPNVKDGIEGKIIEKFAYVQEQKHGRSLSAIEKSDPWPDFTANDGVTAWNIELVELVDSQDAEHFTRRMAYQNVVTDKLQPLLSMCSGIVVTIHDHYTLLPKTETNEGQQILSAIVATVEDVAKDLCKLAPGNSLSRKTSAKSNQVSISFMQTGMLSQAGLVKMDTATVSTSDAELKRLSNVITHKIGKMYSKGTSAKLLLLVYQLRGCPISNCDPALAYARTQIANQKHCFDEIWHFFPVPGEPIGFATLVWPIC